MNADVATSDSNNKFTETTEKRKAEEEHQEDPERDDGKWRTDENKRKAGEESEESRLRKDCEVEEIGQDGEQERVRQSSRGRGRG